MNKKSQICLNYIFLIIISLTFISLIFVQPISATSTIYHKELYQPYLTGLDSIGFFSDSFYDNGQWNAEGTAVLFYDGGIADDTYTYTFNGLNWNLDQSYKLNSTTFTPGSWSSTKHSIYYSLERNQWELIYTNYPGNKGMLWSDVGHADYGYVPGWYDQNDFIIESPPGRWSGIYIVNDIGTYPYDEKQTEFDIFYLNGERWLIGANNTNLYGFKYINDSLIDYPGWQRNNSITNGLTEYPGINIFFSFNFLNNSGEEILQITRTEANTHYLSWFVWNGTGWESSLKYSNGMIESFTSMTGYDPELILLDNDLVFIIKKDLAYVYNGTGWVGQKNFILDNSLIIAKYYDWPTFFWWEESGNKYLIVTGKDAGFEENLVDVYQRTEGNWVTTNNSLMNGLIQEYLIHEAWRPEVGIFLDYSDNKKAVVRMSYDGWYGYDWNGTGFEENVTVASGITGTNDSPEIALFTYGSNTIIIGMSTIDGTPYAFTWNNSGWDTNATWTNGLRNDGNWMEVYAFEDSNNDLKLYIYNGGPMWEYTWNGTGWDYDGRTSWFDGGSGSATGMIPITENGIDKLFVFDVYSVDGPNQISGSYYTNNVAPTAPIITSHTNIWETSSTFNIEYTPSVDFEGGSLTHILYLDTNPIPTTEYDFEYVNNAFTVNVDFIGTTYYYRIRSYDGLAYSPYSETKSFRVVENDGQWHADSSIIAGLDTNNHYITVFNYGSRILSVATNGLGNTFYGYELNTTSYIWEENATIANGLSNPVPSDTQGYRHPYMNVFEYDNSYWMIVGSRGLSSDLNLVYYPFRSYKLNENDWTWELWTANIPGSVYRFKSLRLGSDEGPGIQGTTFNTAHILYDTGDNKYRAIIGAECGSVILRNLISHGEFSLSGFFNPYDSSNSFTRASSYKTINGEHKVIIVNSSGINTNYNGFTMNNGILTENNNIVSNLPTESPSSLVGGLTIWVENKTVKMIKGGSLTSYYIVDEEADDPNWSSDPVPEPTPTPTSTPTAVPTAVSTGTASVISAPFIFTNFTTIEEVKKAFTIFDEIAIFIKKTFSWLFILAAYLGAFIISMLNDRNNEDEISDIGLYGTIALLIPLLFTFIGLINFVTESFWLNAFIWLIFGLTIYLLVDLYNEM